MGIVDWLKRNRSVKTSSAAGQVGHDTQLSMKEERSAPEKANVPIDYSQLIEVTNILTDGDSEALTIISKLVKQPELFEKEHSDWLGEVDFSAFENPDFITAYWLTGYDTSQDFGAYIDWKEETDEIIWGLSTGIKTKGYPVDLSEIDFSGEEFTDEALYLISQYLDLKGFTLVNWDIGGDCYHLYVIPQRKLQALVQIGQTMELSFRTISKPQKQLNE